MIGALIGATGLLTASERFPPLVIWVISAVVGGLVAGIGNEGQAAKTGALIGVVAGAFETAGGILPPLLRAAPPAPGAYAAVESLAAGLCVGLYFVVVASWAIGGLASLTAWASSRR